MIINVKFQNCKVKANKNEKESFSINTQENLNLDMNSSLR